MPNGCVDWLNHLLIDSAVRYLRIESVISDTLIDARRRLVDSHVVDSACAFVFAPTHISPFARSFFSIAFVFRLVRLFPVYASAPPLHISEFSHARIHLRIRRYIAHRINLAMGETMSQSTNKATNQAAHRRLDGPMSEGSGRSVFVSSNLRIGEAP